MARISIFNPSWFKERGNDNKESGKVAQEYVAKRMLLRKIKEFNAENLSEDKLSRRVLSIKVKQPFSGPYFRGFMIMVRRGSEEITIGTILVDKK
jgi:hypothetical protein